MHVANEFEHRIGAALETLGLLPHVGVVAGIGIVGQTPLSLQGVLEQSTVEVDIMVLITPVFHHLQPIAG